MTMFLPNSDVRPTGVEPAEFLESPALPDITNESSSSNDDEAERG
jgi:hypothetical protein